MKLALANTMPPQYKHAEMERSMRQIEQQVNSLAEGRIAARHFTSTTVPTTGTFAQGDIIWKSNPTEAGAAAAKYVIIGWICTVAGSPGTLLEMRTLTGN